MLYFSEMNNLNAKERIKFPHDNLQLIQAQFGHSIAVRPALSDDILDRAAAHRRLMNNFTMENTKMSSVSIGTNGPEEENKRFAC